MYKKFVTDILESGCSAIVRSTPFCVNDLRNMAKSALRSSATLTIIVEENLTQKDAELITSEAPRNVTLDFTRCNF